MSRLIAALLILGSPGLASGAVGSTCGEERPSERHANLGPLLRHRVAEYEADPRAFADPPGRVPVTIYVDAPGRAGEIAAFLKERGGRPGRVFAGAPGDAYGGAVAAEPTVPLLIEVAALPGVRHVREIVPPKADRDGAEAPRAGAGFRRAEKARPPPDAR